MKTLGDPGVVDPRNEVLESAHSVCWSDELTVSKDWTLHQIAPYIGRMKTSMARALVLQHTRVGDLVVDPFCGCGSVALEAAALGRDVVASDWNPYATLLTTAKLFPPATLVAAHRRLRTVWQTSRGLVSQQDLRTVPQWVRKFFHPETLRSALAFRDACRLHDDKFLLACLLGILHHQRPGFLSFPSSHLVPYLRDRNFPRSQYPALYQERDVLPRLEAKIGRALKRAPSKFDVRRKVLRQDARSFPALRGIQAVITSPPYMNELDYVRDNRLRLWFIDRRLPQGLELKHANRSTAFTELMRSVCLRMAPHITNGGHIVLVLGDVSRGGGVGKTGEIARSLFKAEKALRNFEMTASYADEIPDIRRSRRECKGTKAETILVFRKSTQAQLQ